MRGGGYTVRGVHSKGGGTQCGGGGVDSEGGVYSGS